MALPRIPGGGTLLEEEVAAVGMKEQHHRSVDLQLGVVEAVDVHHHHHHHQRRTALVLVPAAGVHHHSMHQWDIVGINDSGRHAVVHR